VTQAIAAHSNRKAQKPFLMPHTAIKPYHNTVAVLTSMHAKERVMAPILRDGLGLPYNIKDILSGGPIIRPRCLIPIQDAAHLPIKHRIVRG
jgi:hypothetical protein